MASKVPNMNAVSTPPPRADEYEVDEPLAGEADEVHASTRRAPVVGHIGQTDHEPQGDGQVDGW